MIGLNWIYKFRLYIGIIFFAGLGFIFQQNLENDPYSSQRIAGFQSILNNRINKADNYLNNITSHLDSVEPNDLMKFSDLISTQLNREYGITILVYSNDSLIFWTSNLVPVETFSVDSSLNNGLARLKDGYYVVRKREYKHYKIFGLIHLKNEYSYENKFIKNIFRHEFNLLPESKIVNDAKAGAKIVDPQNNYLFSIVNDSKRNINLTNAYVASIFYFLAFVCFLWITWIKLKQIRSDFNKNLAILFVGIFLLFIRVLMIKFDFLSILKHLELFKPHLFAISSMVPSLGDLLLHTFFVFYFFLLGYKQFTINHLQLNQSLKNILLLVFIGLSYIWFLVVQYFFQSLILHSSIPFYIQQLFDLSVYTFIGFAIIILLLITVFLFIDKIATLFINRFFPKKLIWTTILIVIVISIGWHFLVYPLGLLLPLFYALVVLIIFYSRNRFNNLGYTSLLILILVFSVYSVYSITRSSGIKNKETSKVLVVNLANERDQIAEMLLETITKQIESDTIVRDLLTWYLQNEGALLDHLQMNYFSGYFIKYDLQVSVCNPNDNLTLILENSTDIVKCYQFFNNIFYVDGTRVKGTNFYFLDNLNGRISYLAQFVYRKPEWNNEVSLFISLDSKLVSKELGYPELLLDKRLSGSAVLSDYSYAKYREKNLVTRSGDFSYQLQMPTDWQSEDEFFFTSDNQFDHLVYNIDKDTQIVISKQSLKFVDVLALFSYVFVLYYLLMTIVFFAAHFPSNIKSFKYDFKNKIKFSMIGLLLLSLVVVGFGTVYYNIDQFEKKLNESVTEKIQSILVEMEHKLGGEIGLTSNYSDYLTYLLTQFSNVFYIDINLYDVDGNLLASSRPQIFEKGLMGKKMNTDAYREMVINNHGKFIHQENIGDLSYLSAYVPFVNDENELLGYLNLPYFTKQSELKKETYTIILAVVNIYFLLILLSVVIAVLISNNITRPLQLIQEKFREMELGKKNEPIQYESFDEIGSLIKEYNRMAEELSENAKKLAKSERESAWREMAKQIAHEIKNPLTPMKLSIQYMQRAWNDNQPDFDQLLKKFTNSLIGQINNLSLIATEFANFASMPTAKKDKVDLISKLNDTIVLFENHENIIFEGNYSDYNELFVFADKEQLLIIFSNLIQNAIQAIPKDKKGKIVITISKKENIAQVMVSDNGTGIPIEMREKMFRPNFTTKSSGMGLGLSIVKNIVTYSGGEIWFETELNKGTSFIFTLPLFNPEKHIA